MKFVIAIFFTTVLIAVVYTTPPVMDNPTTNKVSTSVSSDKQTAPKAKSGSPALIQHQPESKVEQSSIKIKEQTNITEQQSLLEKYLDGKIQFERVNSGELFDYLLTLWDGQSSTITDPIYDITVTQASKVDGPVSIDIMKKTTQEEIDDFRLTHAPKTLDTFRASEEYGEDNPELEDSIQSIADSLDDGLITLDDISCKEIKCVLYAEGNSEQSFDAFTNGLSKLDGYYLTILHPGDPKQALIYITKK